jgi:hypothetical protein
MTRRLLQTLLVLMAGLLSAEAAEAVSPARVDSTARGIGSITVWGKGVDVRVTDPSGRSSWWNGDSLADGIPECEVVGEEPLAEEGSRGDSNPRTKFTLYQLIPGEYEVRVKVRQALGVYVWVDRFSDKSARASADGRATLRRGQVAVWRVSWGCTAGSDTCWATLRQVQGPRTKHRDR